MALCALDLLVVFAYDNEAPAENRSGEDFLFGTRWAVGRNWPRPQPGGSWDLEFPTSIGYL